jgi:hypothetical protein
MTSDVIAIGQPTDQAIVNFLAQCKRLGLDPTPLSLREIADAGTWDLAVPEDGPSYVKLGGKVIPLGDVKAIFCRWTTAPPAGDVAIDARRRVLSNALRLWTLTSGARVVNRTGAASHNGSKSLHETILASAGFAVPATISSSDAKTLQEFCATLPRCVIKTCSGIRARCRVIDPTELEGYASSRGPVHLQEYVRGADLRVHVIDEETVGLLIETEGEAIDHRSDGGITRYSRFELERGVAGALVEATAAQGLAFAGWDFKVDTDGKLWCLEANPMPGYSFYDRRLDGAITRALVRVLWGPDCIPGPAMP